MTELHKAVESGNYSLIRDVLERDPLSMHIWNSRGETPFVTIYESVTFSNAVDKLRTIQLFIDHGVNVNFQSKLQRKTLLHYAMENSQFDGVKLLLENHADPNLRNFNNFTVLHYLVMMSNWLKDEEFERYLKMLLDYGSDINTPADYAPLELAIDHRVLSKAKILMKYGAKVKNVYKMIIDTIINYNSTDLIDFIFAHLVEIDSSGCISMLKMLQFIKFQTLVHEKHINIQEILSHCLEKYGNNVIMTLVNEEKPALHVAVRERNEEKIKFLLDQGADVNCRDNCNNTSLHVLLSCDDDNEDLTYRIAKLLISKGVNIKAKNDFGQDPLNLAFKLSNVKVIKLLLAKISGVSETELTNNLICNFLIVTCVTHIDKLNELDVAVLLELDELVDRLIEMDVTSNSMKNRSREYSSLKYALSNGNKNIIRMLLDADFRCYDSLYKNFYLYNRARFFDHAEKRADIACLFCEYGNFTIIQNFVLIIINMIENYDVGFEFDKFYHLIVYYYAINLKMSKPTVDPLEHCFKSIPKLASILNFCNKKLNELKQIIFYNNISIYDIMCMRFTSLANLMRNSEIFDACVKLLNGLLVKTLEGHEMIIKTQIELAMRRYPYLEKSETFLNEALYPVLKKINYSSLPDPIIQNIMSNLNCRDLKRITKSI